MTDFHTAALTGGIATVTELLANGADLMMRNESGDTPLHLAVWGGHTAVVQSLLNAGADPNAKNDNGDTSLRAAAHYGHINIAQLLLDAGCDQTAWNNNGYAPIHAAMRNGQTEMVEYLTRRGGDQSDFGFTADIVLVGNEWVTVALEFQTDDKIPVVRARGDALLGQRIRELAKEKNIPVIECDPVIVQDIFDNLRAYKAVPEKHFATIASACRGVLQDKGLAFDYVKNEFVKQTPLY